jgi:hypothetical protein
MFYAFKVTTKREHRGNFIDSALFAKEKTLALSNEFISSMTGAIRGRNCHTTSARSS